MRSHFTIISACIRPEIGERIAIGLVLVGENRVFLQFSKNKQSLLKGLLTANALGFLKETIRQITTESERVNQGKSEFFTEDKINNSIFSENYIAYLNRYSNNLLNFSSPSIIELEANEQLFGTLFKKYVDEFAFATENAKENPFETIKAKFFPSVSKFFNIDSEVTAEQIPHLAMPLSVDMIGRNSKPVYAQTVDLCRQNYHIKSDLGLLAILNQACNNESKGFLISSEPDKSLYSKQHDMWRDLRKNDLAEFVDISEVEKIHEYATEHGVRPLMESHK